MSIHVETTSVRMRFKNKKKILSSLNVIGYGIDEMHDYWHYPSIEFGENSTVSFEFSGIDEPRLIRLEDVAKKLKVKGLSPALQQSFDEQLAKNNIELEELVGEEFFDELKDFEPSVIEEIILPNLDWSEYGSEDEPLFTIGVSGRFKERFGDFESDLKGYLIESDETNGRTTLQIKQIVSSISSGMFIPDKFGSDDGYADWYNDYLSIERLFISVDSDFFEQSNVDKINYIAAVTLDYDDYVFAHFEQTADKGIVTFVDEKFSDVICNRKSRTHVLPKSNIEESVINYEGEPLDDEDKEASHRIKELLSSKNKRAALSYLVHWFNVDVELDDYDRAMLSLTFDDVYSVNEIDDFIDALELDEDLDVQVIFDLADEIPKKLLHQIHRYILSHLNGGKAGYYIQRKSESLNDNGVFEYDVSGKLALLYMISEQHLNVQKLWMDETGSSWNEWLDEIYTDIFG